MNYLLFAYFDKTVKNAEKKTQEIGTKIAEHMTSGQVKFMYGPTHAVFHFGYKGEFQDVSDVILFISEEVGNFEYFVTKKSKDYASNFGQENLDHLMTLKKTSPKNNNIEDTNQLKESFNKRRKFVNPFEQYTEIINHFKQPLTCNMTLDELLDKIIEKGMNSLTDLEKQKLEEYSKTI
jgi:hypothetical protein